MIIFLLDKIYKKEPVETIPSQIGSTPLLVNGGKGVINIIRIFIKRQSRLQTIKKLVLKNIVVKDETYVRKR